MKDTDSGETFAAAARTGAAPNRNSRRKHGSRALTSRDKEGLLESRIFPMFYSLRAREQNWLADKGRPNTAVEQRLRNLPLPDFQLTRSPARGREAVT